LGCIAVCGSAGKLNGNTGEAEPVSKTSIQARKLAVEQLIGGEQLPFPYNSPLLFVIPSEPGFPASLLSPAASDVVLSKENHTQLTEAATLDRKSGEAEGSAV
jgi:hypothetical protein